MRVFNDMAKGLEGCDVVIMLRLQNERMNGALLPSAGEFFKCYGLTSEKLALAKPDAIVMHPGPMNRGVEIDSPVADGSQSVILPQVTFGIAVRMAVMSMLGSGMKIEIRDARVIDPAIGPRREGLDLHRRRARSPRSARRRPSFKADETIDAERARRLPRPRRPRPRAFASRASNTRPRSNPRCARPRRAASPRSPARPTPIRRSTSRAWWRCSSAARRASIARACYPLGALTVGLKGTRLAEMAELTEAGCVGFFQANAPLPELATLLQAMRYAATFGYTVWLRPQEASLADGGVAHEGEVATRLGLAAIPVIAETVALRTIIELAAATGARVHVARLSSAAGVALVAEAKSKGAAITCDVGVHHLHLCDRDIGDFDPQCNLSPPLRDPSDRDALRRGLAEGAIDAACSDHTPIDEDAKQVPFAEAEPGATALELLLPLTLQWGREMKLGLVETLGAVTHRPARHPGRAVWHAGTRGHRGHLPLRSGALVGRAAAVAREPGQEHAFPRPRAHGARRADALRRTHRPHGLNSLRRDRDVQSRFSISRPFRDSHRSVPSMSRRRLMS